MRFGIVFAILLPLLTFGPPLRAQSFGNEETSQPSNAAAFGLLTEDHPEPETAKPAEKLQTTEDVARALAEEKAGQHHAHYVRDAQLAHDDWCKQYDAQHDEERHRRRAYGQVA